MKRVAAEHKRDLDMHPLSDARTDIHQPLPVYPIIL